ncbi:transcriptional repressor of class III stress genes [Desulfitobacterium dichloroeliminans LMG P-21439]|uniref:Transcriptional regulator CtsR n=1 Tax=Desulfitobacterium dichloroeliminans (strain LMG P-21439 / DCA1) TaxID=871963 RepID=L0F4H0_DESDL|nr:CtsR family transcriptional regulator [Desulfitobacterium dichloroeliminans]AGA67945.1 transcriptional repressor of class III stress genes [Desulfitobacterium dichloroeliminans LMG P-21439]
MGNLADRIEMHLKRIIEQSTEGFITLQRGILAEEFSCAPSQINYVLETRFSIDRGYLVESRRGGGGYLRIVRLSFSDDEEFQSIMKQLIGNQLTENRTNDLLQRLFEDEIVTRREEEIIKTILHRDSLGAENIKTNSLRAHIMKRILLTLGREDLH